MFGTEEWIIADIESNVFSKPTQLYIDTIEDSEIVVFSLDYLKTDQSTKEKLQKNSKLLARRDHFPGDFVEINIDSDLDQQTAFSFSACKASSCALFEK